MGFFSCTQCAIIFRFFFLREVPHKPAGNKKCLYPLQHSCAYIFDAENVMSVYAAEKYENVYTVENNCLKCFFCSVYMCNFFLPRIHAQLFFSAYTCASFFLKRIHVVFVSSLNIGELFCGVCRRNFFCVIFSKWVVKFNSETR